MCLILFFGNSKSSYSLFSDLSKYWAAGFSLSFLMYFKYLRLSLQTNKRLYADLSEIKKRPKGLTSKSKSAKISSDNDEKSVAEAYHAGLTTQQRRRIQNVL